MFVPGPAQSGHQDWCGWHREVVRAAVQVLSEVASCVAVSFVSEDRAGVIVQVELVPVQGRHAMVAMAFFWKKSVSRAEAVYGQR